MSVSLALNRGDTSALFRAEGKQDFEIDSFIMCVKGTDSSFLAIFISLGGMLSHPTAFDESRDFKRLETDSTSTVEKEKEGMATPSL